MSLGVKEISMEKSFVPDRANCRHHELRLTRELESLPRAESAMRYKQITRMIHSLDIGAVITSSSKGAKLKTWLYLFLLFNWLTLVLVGWFLWLSYTINAWYLGATFAALVTYIAVSRVQFLLNMKLIAIAVDFEEFQTGTRSATSASI